MKVSTESKGHKALITRRDVATLAATIITFFCSVALLVNVMIFWTIDVWNYFVVVGVAIAGGVYMIIDVFVPNRRDSQVLLAFKMIGRVLLAIGLGFAVIPTFLMLASNSPYAGFRLVGIIFVSIACAVFALVVNIFASIGIMRRLQALPTPRRKLMKVRLLFFTCIVAISTCAVIYLWYSYRRAPDIIIEPSSTQGWTEHVIHDGVRLRLPEDLSVNRGTEYSGATNGAISTPVAILNRETDEEVAAFFLRRDVDDYSHVRSSQAGNVIVGDKRIPTIFVYDYGYQFSYRRWYIPCGENYLFMRQWPNLDDPDAAAIAASVVCE